MRVLIVEARPDGKRPLRATEELREITSAVAATPSRQIRVEFCPAADLDLLHAALLRERPDVVHFIGHSDRAALYLQHRRSNAPQPVTADVLEKTLALTGSVRCVVLNSCFSLSLASGVSSSLGITFVGAFSKVGDATAIAFATSFYTALAGGADYAGAYTAATAVAATHEAGDAFGYIPPAQGARRDTGQDDWADAPDLGALVGRDEEVDRLARWITEDGARLIAVWGMRGAGKTHLVTSLRGDPNGGTGGIGGQGKSTLSLAVAEAVSAGFDRVTWRRLLNAPTVQDLVQQIVGLDGVIVPESASATDLVEALLDYLRRKKTLLILDNFESVLLETQPGGASVDGAADPFVTLVLTAALGRHESCILLTSRVVPAEIAARHGPRRPVRLFELGGIDPEHTRDLVDRDGTLSGTESDWRDLNAAYSGNPLALDLAARHVREVHGGNVRAFLDRGHLEFSDVADLVHWHVERLSEPERELAAWLAFNRSPSSLDLLQHDLASHTSRRALPSTLQSLGRKIPLEVSASGFSLQPVLIESLTQRHAAASAAELLSGAPGPDLHSIPLLKATASEPVRQAHQRFVLDEVAALLEEAPIIRRPIEILADAARATPARPHSYALGSVVNLVLRNVGGRLAALGPLSGPIRQADLTTGDVREADLSAAVLEDCDVNYAFGGILALAFDNAERVWAAGTDGQLRAWSAQSGVLEQELQVSDKWVRALAFTQDGSLLVTAGDDTRVRVADVGDVDHARVLTDHTDWVMAAGFAQAGLLVTLGEEQLRLWDLNAAKPGLLALTPHARRMRDVAVDRAGNRLVTVADDRHAKVIALPSGVVEHDHPHPTELRRVAVLPGRDAFVTGGVDGRLRRWEMGAAQPSWEVDHHQAPISALSVSRDARIGVSGCHDGTVQVWDPQTGALLRTLARHDGATHATDISFDARLVVTGGEDQTVRTWDLTTGSLVRAFTGYANGVWSVDHWPGLGLVSAHEDGTARLWDTARTWPSALSPDVGPIVYARRRARTTAWQEDTASLFVGGDDGSILRVSDTTARWAGHTGRITQIQVVDGERIVSASGDGTLRVWDVGAAETVHLLTCEGSGQNGLSVSPGGATVWSGGDDAALREFDLRTGELLRTLTLPARIWSVAVAPDGRRVAAAAADGVTHIMDVATGEVCARLGEHVGWVWCARWLGADRLVTGGEDGRVAAWDLGDSVTSPTWSRQISLERVRTLAVLGPDLIAAGSDDGGIRTLRVGGDEVGPTRHPPRPYEGVRLGASSGLSPARVRSLRTLGAVTVSTPQGRVTP